MKKLFSLFLVLFFFVFAGNTLRAQLTGTKNIPGDYADLTAAISDLNIQGVGAGGVTFNVLAGNPQSAPAGGYSITTLTGTSGNQIIIQGNNNTITASNALTVGALNDAIFKIIGADYVSITGFTMTENAANTTTAAATNNMTEWGVALLYATTINGCQNITISNNTIDLNRTYQNTFGIYSNSTHSATAISTSATATGTAGGNHNLVITGNSITDVNQGIVVVGPTAAADQNDNITIGGSLLSANSITNYGTTGTFSGYVNVSGTVNGILMRNTKNFTISYNTITSSNGGTTSGTLRGVYVPSFSIAPTGTYTHTINNNVISVRSAVITGAIQGIIVETTTGTTTSTLNVSNNDFNTIGHTVAGTGAITLISNAMTSQVQNISGNTFTNINCNTTGSFTFITNSITLPTGGSQNVNNNSIVTAFNKTGAGGTVTIFTTNGSSVAGTTVNNNNNNFSNITVTGATTLTGWSNTDGGSPTKTIQNNTFNNWVGGTSTITGMAISFSGSSTFTGNTVSNISSAGAITGITTGSGTDNLFSNTVHTLSSTGASAVTGIAVTSGTAKNIYKNKIYNLTSNNASGTANGILVTSGTTVNIYNNLIGDLKTPSSNAANPLNGINVTGGTTINVYYNSVYLNATSSGALFGSSAASISTTPTVTLKDNIFVNLSTPVGATGYTVAYRRSTTTLTSYGSTSNFNLFYAGTPGANNLIFSDGTNLLQTLANYKALSGLAPRDANSITESPTFLSTTGSSVDFLHISTVVPTQIESGGNPVSGITDDYDGNTRNASNPDIGGDEFNGLGIDVGAPIISYTVLSSTCSTGDRTLAGVTITDASGVPTAGSLRPRIYYRKNAGTWFSQPGSLISGSATNGTWDFTIVAADMGGLASFDAVQYYVIAQDIVGTPNIGSNPSGAVATDVNTVTSPPGSPNTFNIGGTLSGSYNVGVGQTYTTLTAAVTAYNSACGLLGAVTFVLVDATYPSETFPITINASPYSSGTNTLTIKPGSGVNASISGNSTTAIIKINGGDYITIDGSNNGTNSRNLTLNNTNTGATSSAVWMGSSGASDGALNNTIKNTIITGGTGTTTIAGIIIGSAVTFGSAAESSNNNTTIQNNLVTKFQNGIFHSGNAASYDANMVVSDNTLGSATVAEKLGFRGMIVQNVQNITISGNTILGVVTASTSTSTGIQFSGLLNGGNVYNNRISDIKNTNTGGYGSNGIYLNSSSTAAGLNVYNNFIWDVASYGWTTANAADNGYGIMVNTGGGYNIYYNSVSMTTNQTATGGLPAAINFSSSLITAGSINLRNNIFSNTQTVGTNRYAIYCSAASSIFAAIDYNDYYAGTAPNLGYIGGNRAALADIQTGFGSNVNSKAVNPGFTSGTDLHLLTSSLLEATATPIGGITTDIDGTTRNATTPDIGADEFTGSDLNPPTISYTVLGNTSSFSNRSFTAITITDVSGVNTTPGTMPRCYYKRSSDLNEFNNNGPGTDGWKYAEANGSTSPFDFTIDYSLLNGGGGVTNGDVIQYFVVAEDLAGTPNVGINSGTFAVAQVTCNLDPSAFPIGGTINSYQIVGAPLSGSYTVGVSMMRTLSGKDLKFEARTRKVKTMVPDENAVNRTKKEKDPNAKAPNTTSAFDQEALNRPMKQVEIEETYYELTENGVKYDGPMYMEYPNGNTKLLNRPGSENGGSTDLMGNYATITAAVTDLNSRGVSGPVTFLLIDNGAIIYR